MLRASACHLAAGVAAHAIDHQPQGQLAVTVVGVFVELAAQAGVGEVSEFDHGVRGGVLLGRQASSGLRASGKACAQEIFLR
jgi:hypothetical protein